MLAGLITGFIPPPKGVLADSSRIVSIYYDGQKRIITTGDATVGDILRDTGVHVGPGDLVEPNSTTPVTPGFFNINIYRARPVVVVDGQSQKTVLTAYQSPRLIAEAVGLHTFSEDTYDLSVVNNFTDNPVVGEKLTIHRALPVVILADGQETTVRTQQKTVGGLLDERDVALGPEDVAIPSRETTISANTVVQINRVRVAIVKVTDPIAFNTSTSKDATLLAGANKTVTEGVNGSKDTVFRVHYTNGVEQGREALSSTVTLAPVTRVLVIGTKVDYSANPVELGRQMAAARGWTDDQWTSLFSLWQHESGWNPKSTNFFSGACGIPQAYPCSKITDKSTEGQISWGLSYIAGKYGDPNRAWAYWLSHNSY